MNMCKQYSEQQRMVGAKRNNTHITPPENQGLDRKATSDTRRGQTDTYASVTRVTEVAILPLEFPKITIPQVDLGLIENLLATCQLRRRRIPLSLKESTSGTQ